ncbi:hypothetical protein U9M48_036734 [Paspalum notatum var. saurae]|uniref:non-specific serine/threonine protein kinase n=1 Tax=Paspalum notatum var. saurae TaxID=547442 RepID=A0AAQ3XBG0_PASNO
MKATAPAWVLLVIMACSVQVVTCSTAAGNDIIDRHQAAAIGRFLLVLMASSVYVTICSSSNTTPGNKTDRLSLLEFKNWISLDPQQALASWNDSTHFCNWEGVSCRTTSNRVTNLDLGNRGLVGQISPSLGNLTFLKHLSLATNRFSGQIPASLGQLYRLQTLYLSNNTLHGVIPAFQNCSNLQKLWLDGNNLLGDFPGLPLGLKQLLLESNNLSGTIPPSLANITTLKDLGFTYNNIEGNFPHEFAMLPELQSLGAGANHLAVSLSSLPYLEQLDLSFNNISDALEYLHHGNQGTIVHCDLKPANILFDDNMTAHVGDFGLARFKFDSAAALSTYSISTSAAIMGTIGYIAPEFAAGGAVSSAADVYSFGIVLYEIFLRRRPTDDMFNGGMNITKFVEMNFPDMVPQIIDPQLLEEQQDLSQETSFAIKQKSLECLLSVLSIGLLCTKPSPNERISMQEAAARLHDINKAFPREN